MNEHDGTEPNLGISRRTLLRRGAVVGGTLMWTAPMVKSLTPAAFGADMGPSPGRSACCSCSDPVDPNAVDDVICDQNGFNSQRGRLSRDNCENFCRDSGFRRWKYQTSNADFCSCINGICACPNPIVDEEGDTGL